MVSHHVNHLCERLRKYVEEKREANLSDAMRSMMSDLSTALIVDDCENLLGEDDFGHESLKRFSSLMRYSSLQRHFPWATGLLQFIPDWVCDWFFPIQSFRKVSLKYDWYELLLQIG